MDRLFAEGKRGVKIPCFSRQLADITLERGTTLRYIANRAEKMCGNRFR